MSENEDEDDEVFENEDCENPVTTKEAELEKEIENNILKSSRDYFNLSKWKCKICGKSHAGEQCGASTSTA